MHTEKQCIAPWTEPEISLLRDSWSKGMTGTAISRIMPWRSRSSILGKVFRLRLEGRGSPIPHLEPRHSKTGNVRKRYPSIRATVATARPKAAITDVEVKKIPAMYEPLAPLPAIPKLMKSMSYQEIIHECAKACDVSYGEVIGDIRVREVVEARALFTAVMRSRGNSYRRIGDCLGGRDHSTVINLLEVFFKRSIHAKGINHAWLCMVHEDLRGVRSADELNEIVSPSVRR